MGSENKELIRQMYEAFRRGDIDSVLANVTDDFTWYAPGVAPFAGLRRGPGEMRDFFTESARWVRVDQFDVDEILADGDRVVVLGRQRGTVRESGRHFET